MTRDPLLSLRGGEFELGLDRMGRLRVTVVRGNSATFVRYEGLLIRDGQLIDELAESDGEPDAVIWTFRGDEEARLRLWAYLHEQGLTSAESVDRMLANYLSAVLEGPQEGAA